MSNESTKNPYKFCRESPENPQRINMENSLNFHVDSRFTDNPNFPQNPRDFARWEYIFYTLLFNYYIHIYVIICNNNK